MENLYQRQRVVNWISPIIYLIIGVCFVAIPSDKLLDIIFTVIGIFIIVMNFVPCLFYFMLGTKDNRYYVGAVSCLISVIIGFVFIFNRSAVLAVILGIWLIVLPIVRIVLDQNKKEAIIKAIPYFIIAVLLFFIPASSILDVVLKVFGVILMVIGVAGLIFDVIIANKYKNGNGSNNNGNNASEDREVIDVEYKEL